MVTKILEDVESTRGAPTKTKHSRKGKDRHSELTMFISILFTVFVSVLSVCCQLWLEYCTTCESQLMISTTERMDLCVIATMDLVFGRVAMKALVFDCHKSQICNFGCQTPAYCPHRLFFACFDSRKSTKTSTRSACQIGRRTGTTAHPKAQELQDVRSRFGQ